MVILIVDDNAAVRRVIRSVLAELDAVIYDCSAGEEAMAMLASCAPNWVLMDIELQGVDGITTTREITSRWPDAKVCMVTDYDDEELRRAARRAGACAYVVKDDLLSLPDILRESGADAGS